MEHACVLCTYIQTDIHRHCTLHHEHWASLWMTDTPYFMLDRISFFPANQISPDCLLTWPLQDILSIPYEAHGVHTHHTYEGILMRLIQGELDECVMWAVSEAATYPPYVFSSSVRSTSFPFPCPECIPYFLVLLLHSGCEPLESLTYHTKLTTPYPVKNKNNITNREIRLNLPWNAVSRALGNQIQTCRFCLLFVVCCSVSSAWIFPFWSITITNLAAAHDHHAGRHAGWHHGVALSME